MIYGSVCSGIEAASVAWHPLGWRAAFVSEIEAFPRAVLAHHYPDVPLHGDFTTIQEGQYAAIDVLVGGTPCQSFSVAGLRGGLADDRGNLALEYLRLAQRLRPKWLVWENVPGVLSSAGGRDFGSILGGLGQLGYGFAYRVLDAQYVRARGFLRAVPQRRRRVFVVGHLGDWRRAAAVLFERESLCGNPPPRREAGKGIAGTVTARVGSGVGADENHARDGHLVASTVSSKWAKGCGGYAGQNETENCCIVPAQDPANCLGAAPAANTSHGEGQQNYAVVAPVASTLNAHFGDKWGLEDQHINEGAPLFVAHALRADGFDASEDGTGRGTPLVPVAMAFHENQRGELTTSVTAGSLKVGGGKPGQGFPAIAFNWNAQPDQMNFSADTVPTLSCSQGAPPLLGWRVRRLTPTECERLQGFPDGYTAIPFRGKIAADGNRYKALGNSMAVNVMRWIGQRIQTVQDSCASVGKELTQ